MYLFVSFMSYAIKRTELGHSPIILLLELTPQTGKFTVLIRPLDKLCSGLQVVAEGQLGSQCCKIGGHRLNTQKLLEHLPPQEDSPVRISWSWVRWAGTLMGWEWVRLTLGHLPNSRKLPCKEEHCKTTHNPMTHPSEV